MTTADLPALNALLNSIATVLLTTGYFFIRRENVRGHKFCMLGACGVSCCFLVSYVTYHAIHGTTEFTHVTPGVRLLYFVILIPHVILAATVVPMVLITVTRALKGRFDQHKRIARYTLPIWLYVSVTGVLVYLMLYEFFPNP